MSTTQSNKSTTSSKFDQQKFFGQTYYLFLILLILNFFFSVYLYFKIEGNTNPVAAAPIEQGADTADTQPAADPADVNVSAPTAEEPWRGEENARYVLIEYSDYECPFCQSVHPDLQQLESEDPDLAWVFRDFPLSFHPKAEPLSEAAWCAREQGGNAAYWTLSDAIFNAMPDLEVSGIADLAAQSGLDGTAIQNCLDAGTYDQVVKDSLAAASSAGIAATPTVVLYDTQTDAQYKIEGALPYDSLKQTLEDFKAGNL